MTEKENKRKLVIPGEIIGEGEDLLPGENTRKEDRGIISLRYGLAEEQNKLIKVIPVSGAYQPRRGNVTIGKVVRLTMSGWLIDIGSSEDAFLPLSEVPKYVDKNALEEVLDIGDLVAAKIKYTNRKGADLTIKQRGLGKIEEGIILNVNPNKVPRVIGKEGSMIKLIKENTDCNITVGQNGLIWIKGNEIENEILAKKAILFVTERSHISGLTDQITEWFGKNKIKDKKTEKKENKEE